MTELNLNEQRAARQEIAGPAPAIVIGESRIELPRELQLRFATEFLDKLEAGEIEAALRIVLKPDQFDAFMAEEPTIEDLGALAAGLPKLYGLELGKSGGSRRSSASGSRSSKRTSKGSTGSTSGAKSKTPV